MFRVQLGPSFEFIVNAPRVLDPSHAFQCGAFGEAGFREFTCALGERVHG